VTVTLSSPRTIARLVDVLDGWPFWLAAWTAIAIVRGVGMASRYINHDAAWYLYMARVMLDGGHLYRDVVDTNPPLIVWLTVPPAFAARVLNAPESLMFVLYMLLVTAASLTVCARLVARVWPELPAHLRLALVTLLLFLFFVRVHTEFGQREHFTLLLSLPYVLAAMAWTQGRPLGRWAGLAAGIGAGLGLALKPHLLVPALLVEGYLAFSVPDRRPWRRPEAVALGVTVVGYGLAVLLLVPAYFDVAWRAARVYGGLNPPAVNLLRVPEVPLWALTALLLWLIRLPARSRHAWVVLFLAATGFLIAGLGQMKGWEYHLYPARVTLTLLLAAQVLWLLHAVGDLSALLRGGSRTIAALLAIALVVGTGRQTVADRQPDTHDLVTPLRALVERDAHGGPIFVMGMLLYPAFPLVNVARVGWSSRHNSFWFLPGLYVGELAAPGTFRFKTVPEMPAIERAFYDEVIGDLCARPPTVLIVESVTHYAADERRPFDLLAYYGQDVRFARLFAAYAPVDRVGAFSVYVPRTPPGCAQQNSQAAAGR
jgi:hypothetical protein